jgi:hypothetical protein
MMMTFICSCTNNNQPAAIYPLGTEEGDGLDAGASGNILDACASRDVPALPVGETGRQGRNRAQSLQPNGCQWRVLLPMWGDWVLLLLGMVSLVLRMCIMWLKWYFYEGVCVCLCVSVCVCVCVCVFVCV